MSTTSGILAVDIGGTKLAAAVVTAQGEIIRRDRVATPARAPWVTLSALIKRIQATASDIELVACGVACGGPMKIGGTEVSPLHIPTWIDFPLLQSISELTGLKTYIDNDAKALALAEGWKGAARDCANFMAVVIGTGVGGGLVINNRLAVGRSGNAGHFGHIAVGGVRHAIVRILWPSSLEQVLAAVWSKTIDWRSVEVVTLATLDTSWSEAA